MNVRIARFWHRYHWPVTAVLAVSVFVLGYIGSRLQNPDLTQWDWLYDSMRLFWAGGDLAADNTALNLARFLAPLIAIVAILQTLAGAVVDSTDRLFARWVSRRHVVVCGAGATGGEVVRGVVEAELDAVVLDRDPPIDEVYELRSVGARLIIGDCRNLPDLRLVGAERARYVIAVTNDDEANIKAIEHVRSCSERMPVCIAHVGDISLWPELSGRFRQQPEVRLVNHFDQSAITMLNRLPAFSLTEPDATDVAIIGTGSLCTSLVAHLAKRWQIKRGDQRSKTRVLIVGEDATDAVQHLEDLYPDIDALLALTALDLDTSGLDATKAKRIVAERGGLHALYVALEDEGQATVASISLRSAAEDTCIAVRLDRDSALLPPEREKLYVVSPLETFRDADLLLQDFSELMAETAHAEYCRMEPERARRDKRPESRVASLAWGELHEYRRGKPRPYDHVKAQNRSQAHFITEQLHQVRCEVTPILDWDTPLFAFTTAEVELLAAREHDRWMKTMRGLEFGDAPELRAESDWRTDYARRRTAFFVPFSELPPFNQDKDRAAVRNIPWLLALVGLRPCRR